MLRWGIYLITVGIAVSLCIAGLGCAGPRAATQQPPGTQSWTPLFNGVNLTGWESSGGASWTVDNGSIVGRQGPGNAPGDLLTAAEYGDFELLVTFKMQWPGNSGVWFRYQSDQQAYQADILEYTNPVCYTGSLYCTGKMFLALNTDPALVNRDSWNTLLIRAQGNRIQLTLNGTVTANVTDETSAHGRIGFQVHAGEEFADMEIQVREVLIRPLSQ